MNTPDEIYTLVDRFLDGLTTLDEERRLADFFAEHAPKEGTVGLRPAEGVLPEHLQIVAQMFAEIRALADEEIVQEPCAGRRPTLPWWTTRLKWAGVAAAIIAAIIGTVLLLKAPGVATPEPPVIAQQQSTPDGILEGTVGLRAADDDSLTVVVPEHAAPAKKTSHQRRKSAPAPSREPEHIALVQNLIEEYMAPQQCSYDYDDEPMAMRSDVAVRAMVLEYDMMMLEEEFNESEQNRHIIEI